MSYCHLQETSSLVQSPSDVMENGNTENFQAGATNGGWEADGPPTSSWAKGTTQGATLSTLLPSQYVESNFIGRQPGPAGAAYASGYCLSVSEAPLLTMTAGYRGSRNEVRKRYRRFMPPATP